MKKRNILIIGLLGLTLMTTGCGHRNVVLLSDDYCDGYSSFDDDYYYFPDGRTQTRVIHNTTNVINNIKETKKKDLIIKKNPPKVNTHQALIKVINKK